ncbi:MAG: redoxin domain-containing protein [Chitinophagaceae bacterium]
MPEIGQKAPAFSLYDTEKTKVSLEDFLGKKVLLLFFPLAFSSVCTKELCSVRDGITAYNNLNAVVLGISVDSIYTLKKFKEDQSLTFTLLSDFNKEISKAYDALYDLFSLGMKGVSKRAAFVIDQQGVLQYKEVLNNSGELPDFIAIKKVLESIA